METEILGSEIIKISADLKAEKENENQTADAGGINKFDFAFTQTADLSAMVFFLVSKNQTSGLNHTESDLRKFVENEIVRRGEYAATPFLNELIKLNSETNTSRSSELDKQTAENFFNDADEDLFNAQKSLIESRPEIEKAADTYLHKYRIMTTGSPSFEKWLYILTDFATEQIAEFCGFELPETKPADDQKKEKGIKLYCGVCDLWFEGVHKCEPEAVNKINQLIKDAPENSDQKIQYNENCSDCGKELNPNYAVIPNDEADDRFFCSVECLNHLFDLKPADAPDADGTNALLNKSKE